MFNRIVTERSAGEEGVVSIVVRVNEKAYTKGKIQNRAFVQVDNDSEVETETPTNPVEPTPPSESTTDSPSEPSTNPPSESTADTPDDSSTDTPNKQPNTGDNSHLGIWITLMTMSMLGLCGMIAYRQRKRKRSE